MPAKAADRLREICLGLPRSTEVAMKRGPTYRIDDKIFALERPRGGAVTVWCKVPPGSQAVLVGSDAKRFFVPPFFGTKGWIGMTLDDKPDWKEVAALVERSYRLVAPKRRA